MTRNKTYIKKNSFILASALVLISSSIVVVSAHRPSYKPDTGVIEQCDYPGIDGLFVTKDKYAYSNASLACESYGGSLADITNQNYLLGADMTLTCIGPNSKVWIGSWDYKDLSADPQKGVYDCLSLVVGNIGPGAGVDKNCAGIIPVLCQNHPTVVLHNSQYSESPQSPGSYPPPTLLPMSVFEDDFEDDEEDGYPVYYPDLNGAVYRPMALPQQPANPYDANAPSYPVHYPSENGVYEGNPAFYSKSDQYRPYDKAFLREANLRGDYRKPIGYIHEGPKGGFPGGIFPGGPGFGSEGYPFGYPYRYHGGHGEHGEHGISGEEDCELSSTTDVFDTLYTPESISSATIVI